MPSIFDEPDEMIPTDEPLYRPAFDPDSQAETTRKSGLAYSAGIVIVVSVAFMLLLGWGADLILGSSPWGLVGGIVLGSIIGFTQFFRITSLIFKVDKDAPAVRPLMSSPDRPDEADRL